MYSTIQGLVLRITNYNDTDALLTVLTQNNGKLTLKARGLRRKNSPLSAACQLLAYNEFVLFEYRGMYTINEAHSIDLFQELRKDLQKLSLATYFSQVAEVLSQEDIPNPDLLPLLLNSIYAISKLNVAEQQVKAVFELRAACVAGFSPDLHGCSRCGCVTADRFNITAGQLECNRCDSFSDGIRMPLNAGALEAMRYICTCDGNRLFSFRIGQDSLQYLCQVTESYLATQLERGFSSLDFYKSLFIEL